MLKKTLCLSAAMLLANVAHAEELYQPRAEATVFYSYMQVLFGDDVIFDNNGQALRLRKPKGSGAGVRGNAFLSKDLELTGEASMHPLQIDGDNSKLEFDLTQFRGGIRSYARPTSSEYPVYAAAGLEYAHFRVRSKINFDSNVTESQAGENPSADADTNADNIPLDKRNSNFGIGHVRAGYSSVKTHTYADLGYGYSDDNTLFEGLLGLTYRISQNFSMSGEYRSTLIKGSGDNERYTDIRLGLGMAF